MENREILTVTVSALNNYIKRVIENNSYLKEICIKGEVSNCKYHTSGHIYLTLKDEGSVLRAVMFKGAAQKMRFPLENGMKIVARGRVSVYERDGQYQLYIEEIVPDGEGALYVAFEKLKKQLSEEGLFDEKHKKPLPEYPVAIGVVTASTGAAVRDIINVLKRRYPLAKVKIFPVAVQGAEAAGEITHAIEYLNEHKLCDVMIVGRGGGSIEDLWAFNEEIVARAIFKSEIPIISAVGHEVDFTIADFVADLRAPTPSAAAEVCVPSQTELLQKLISMKSAMMMKVTAQVDRKKHQLMLLQNNPAFKMFHNTLRDKQIEVDSLLSDMQSAMEMIISTKQKEFMQNTAKLDALSPLKVLSRGYAVARKEDGGIVKSVRDVSQGEKINLKLSDGDVLCGVI